MNSWNFYGMKKPIYYLLYMCYIIHTTHKTLPNDKGGGLGSKTNSFSFAILPTVLCGNFLLGLFSQQSTPLLDFLQLSPEVNCNDYSKVPIKNYLCIITSSFASNHYSIIPWVSVRFCSRASGQWQLSHQVILKSNSIYGSWPSSFILYISKSSYRHSYFRQITSRGYITVVIWKTSAAHDQIHSMNQL